MRSAGAIRRRRARCRTEPRLPRQGTARGLFARTPAHVKGRALGEALERCSLRARRSPTDPPARRGGHTGGRRCVHAPEAACLHKRRRETRHSTAGGAAVECRGLKLSASQRREGRAQGSQTHAPPCGCLHGGAPAATPGHVGCANAPAKRCREPPRQSPQKNTPHGYLSITMCRSTLLTWQFSPENTSTSSGSHGGGTRSIERRMRCLCRAMAALASAHRQPGDAAACQQHGRQAPGHQAAQASARAAVVEGVTSAVLFPHGGAAVFRAKYDLAFAQPRPLPCTDTTHRHAVCFTCRPQPTTKGGDVYHRTCGAARHSIRAAAHSNTRASPSGRRPASVCSLLLSKPTRVRRVNSAAPRGPTRRPVSASQLARGARQTAPRTGEAQRRAGRSAGELWAGRVVGACCACR